MDFQNRLATPHVGPRYNHATVETAGPQQGRIEYVGAIGCGDEDDAFVGLKAIHFHQQLVQSLLTLVVSPTQACAAMAADGVDFIDEDDARSVLLALLEKIAYAGSAHAHEHLNKVRARYGEEGNIGLARDGPRQQGFSGSRRAYQQYAFGNTAAQLLEFLRLTQKLNNFVQLFLGLFDTRNVFKSDLLLLAGMQAGTALPEG